MSLEKVQKREEKSGFLKKFSYFFVLFVGLSAVASPKIANADFFSGLDVNKENHRVPEPSNIENLLNVNDESGKQGISNALRRYLLRKSIIEFEIRILKRRAKEDFYFRTDFELKIEENEKSLKSLRVDFFWEIVEKLEAWDLKRAESSDKVHAFKKFEIILHNFEENYIKNKNNIEECNLKLKGFLPVLKSDTVQSVKQKKEEVREKIKKDLGNFIKGVFWNTPNGEKYLIGFSEYNYGKDGGILNLPKIIFPIP
ncbi:MAG: hypothetical protein KAI16_01765 [Candidatus Pacebacteria bacterium]|nr:hypothetical protein [Candidatus Paceibacterota bacterium]